MAEPIISFTAPGDAEYQLGWAVLDYFSADYNILYIFITSRGGGGLPALRQI